MKKIDTITTGLNHTIDLRAIMIEDKYKENFRSKILNIITQGAIILGMTAVACVMIFVLSQTKASANNIMDNKDFMNLFPLEKRVIGCYNSRDKTARHIEYNEKCTKWGDHNITLPPRSHIAKWLEVYTPRQIINRLPIANFESNFNEKAENKGAIGYLQTLKSYKIKPDMLTQLKWMKKREGTYAKEYYYGRHGTKITGCGFYWNNYNSKDGFNKGEDGVISCLYRYHYDANKGVWYSNKAMKARKIYFNYFNMR